MDENDRLVLQSLINILELRSSIRWDFLSERPGQVSIIDVDSDAGQRVWEELSGCPDRIVIAYGQAQSDSTWHLTKPLRSRAVLSLLQEITREQWATDGKDADEPPAINTAELSGKQFFQQLIDLFDSGTWALRDEDRMLLIDGPGRRAHFRDSLESLSGMARKSFSRIKVLPIDPEGLSAAAASLESISAPALIWHFARYHSLALQADLQNREYRLRRWPNLRQLGATREDARHCAAFSRRWASIEELEKSIGAQDANGLLNALSAVGLLDTREKTPAVRNVSAPESSGLFSRIRQRLGVGT